jgi:hypothetical protein
LYDSGWVISKSLGLWLICASKELSWYINNPSVISNL